MNRTKWIVMIVLAAAAAVAVTSWVRVAQLRAEAAALQEQLQALQQQTTTAASDQATQQNAELEKLRAQSQELLRLRNEVSQLRSTAKEAEKLRADNLQLRAENQQLRASAADPSPAPTAAGDAKDQFPRNSWAFSGYATPDAALISAIWAMKEGNPKTYLDSLAPEEKARMSKVWENKSEAEIAAKHQQDVSSITGMRILDRTTVAPDQVQMNVYIQGADRMEKVSMILVNNEWKFGGYIRDPKK
jgi:type II secretory pathway pseudopilin PulG